MTFCITEKADAKIGAVGISTSQDIAIAPDSQQGDVGELRFAIKLEYYFSIALAAIARFEVDLEAPNNAVREKSLHLGGKYIFRPLDIIMPYVVVDAVFVLDPDVSTGLRGGGGLAFDLFTITGVDGLNLFYEAAVRSVFIDADINRTSIEFFRTGILYIF